MADDYSVINAANSTQQTQNLGNADKLRNNFIAEKSPLVDLQQAAKKLDRRQAKNTFNKDIENSKLDERVPNKTSLKKMGFNVPFKAVTAGNFHIPEQEYIVDMNGGRTYQNANGDTIRICEFEGEVATGMRGSTSVQYRSADGKTQDSVIYDPDGNPINGYLTVKRDDGSIVKYTYEFDMDGNKNVKSSTTEYPNENQ